MSLSLFLTIFGTVFLAELGDKTQLATVLFAAKGEASKYAVFSAASLALVLSTAAAVLVGSFVSNHLNPQYLSYVAGAGFIAIGAWTIWQA
jgi:putative Ca2+/H+ antiporter (TMEM165/GDT1 family)